MPRNVPEDRFTHTVEDAAAYERWRSRQAGEDEPDTIDLVDEADGDEDEEPGYCGSCAGSGEGPADGTYCGSCRGTGEARPRRRR